MAFSPKDSERAGVPEEEQNYTFQPGTVIYPYGGNFGWTISERSVEALEAVLTTGKQGKLSVFTAKKRAILYRDGKYITLVEGKTFCAYKPRKTKTKNQAEVR